MKSFLFCLSVFSIAAIADYAWIPEPEHLILKTGWEFLKSEANFDSSGSKRELTTNSSPATLTQNLFALDAEYGLSEYWSGILRTGILSAEVKGLNSNFAPLSGTGLFDTALGFKWRLKQDKPVLALETVLVFAPYSTKNLAAQDLAIGDGVTNVLVRVHGGTRLKKLSFSFSPGLLFRFGQYSHQAVVDAAISVTLRKVYFRIYESSVFSISKDPAVNQGAENLEPGSGGSFTRLAFGPDLFILGLKAGVFLSPKFKIETGLSQTLWGRSAPDGFRVGVSLISNLDLHPPDNREPVREIPLSSE